VLTNVLAQASGETQAESVLHEVASWWLLICGIIYTAAGLLCIGRIKHSHLRAVHRRQQAIKDLEVYPLFSELHGRIKLNSKSRNCVIVGHYIDLCPRIAYDIDDIMVSLYTSICIQSCSRYVVIGLPAVVCRVGFNAMTSSDC
jgi:hypothetical protein